MFDPIKKDDSVWFCDDCGGPVVAQVIAVAKDDVLIQYTRATTGQRFEATVPTSRVLKRVV